jgi:hypothetical protein
MKIRTIQFILGTIFTFLGLFIGFANSIEEPLYVGEDFAGLFVVLLNSFWLVPYLYWFGIRHDFRSLLDSIVTYLIFVLPVIAYVQYRTPFDSNRWKNELNRSYIYVGNTPAHANGNMVEDIIDKKLLEGLTINQAIDLLGKNYFIEIRNGDTFHYYPYSNGNPFDGCDKLYVEVANGMVKSYGFGGCD